MKNIILLNDNLTDKYIFWSDSPPKIIAINANIAPNDVVITITFLLSYLSEKYPIGPWKITPAIVAINNKIDVSNKVKLEVVAYTAIKEKKAEWIKPVQKELTVPNGEILYNSFILIVPIFLNFGADLFVKSIGTNAKESRTETNIKGS